MSELDAQLMVNLMTSFATTPQWLQYDDVFDCARVQPKLLEANADLWNAAYDAKSSIRLTRMQAVAVCKGVLKNKIEAKEEPWIKKILTPEMEDDWVDTMQNRIRASAVHIIEAARRKKDTPKWAVRAFPNMHANEQKTLAAPVWKFDFDLEHCKAYRVKSNGKSKEFAKTVEIPETEGPIIAHFQE